MHIISKKPLREFWQRHRDAEPDLDEWHRTVQRAHWTTPADVRSQYSDASILRNNRVIFNIKGNAYRLIVRIDYTDGVVFIRFVGTHAQYDRINALEV